MYAGRDETTGRDIRLTRSVAAPHWRASKEVRAAADFLDDLIGGTGGEERWG